MSDRNSSLLLRWVAVVIGTALLTAAVFVLMSDRLEVVSLIVAGSTFVLAGLFIERIAELRLGPGNVSLTLRAELAEAGAPQLGRLLIKTEIPKLVEAYAQAHWNQEVHSRIAPQDRLVDQARAIATMYKLDGTEVANAFSNGSPAMRVVVLGLLKGDPSLITEGILQSAIENSRTANEQYHALWILEHSNHKLSPEVVERLCLAAAATRLFGASSARADVVRQLAERYKFAVPKYLQSTPSRRDAAPEST